MSSASPYVCCSSNRKDIEAFIKDALDEWENLPEEDQGPFLACAAFPGRRTADTTNSEKRKKQRVYYDKIRLVDIAHRPPRPRMEMLQFTMTRPLDA